MSRFKDFLDSYNLPAVVAFIAGVVALVAAYMSHDTSTVAVVIGLVAVTSSQLA